MFAGTKIMVIRLALNWSQIKTYDPPPNPAKVTDSRFYDYSTRYGNSSWELDALEPKIIHDLIRDAVLQVRDPKLWDAALRLEAEDKNTLDQIIEEL